MPKPFFTKLVAISAIGFFCVLFGCIFGIATHDRLFILMSLLIGICSILRALSFYHLIHTHAYLSLDVSCTKREQTLFGKNQQYWFASDNGKEYAFSLEKNIKLLEGHRYRLYFRKPQQGTGQSMPCAGDILGYLGNTGYGKEGTKGKFDVHLHFGIYVDIEGKEVSVNPYYILKWLEQ